LIYPNSTLDDRFARPTGVKGFYLEYRALLTSDVVHLNRRADGQGLDAILHVNPLLGSSSSGDDDTTGNGNSNGNGNGGSALLVVFNPTDADVAMSLAVPLYYSGIEDVASVEEGPPGPGPVTTDGASEPVLLALNRRYEAKVGVQLAARSARWYLITDASNSTSGGVARAA
jgi:hypothetical protein